MLLPLTVFTQSWSQWSCGLRHESFSPAETLGSWVRIPLKVWISVCVYSVYVLFFLYVAALQWADTPSKESYRLCIGLRNWKSGLGPKGYRAIEWEKNNVDTEKHARLIRLIHIPVEHLLQSLCLFIFCTHEWRENLQIFVGYFSPIFCPIAEQINLEVTL
jgi:hypothetical protein